MKKSLEILFVTSDSGISVKDDIKPLDVDVLRRANEIRNINEKIIYLKDVVKETSQVYFYPKSTIELIKLIKKNDPVYAIDLSSALSKCFISEPLSYCLYAEVAMEHKAWLVAKSALEVAKWLSVDKYNSYEGRVNSLFRIVLSEIIKKEDDSSIDSFWSGKIIDKSRVLLALCNVLDEDNLLKYSIRLLKLFPEDTNNYELVFEALCSTENCRLIKGFINNIKSDGNLNPGIRDFYLARAYFELVEPMTAKKYFDEAIKVKHLDITLDCYIALNSLIGNNLEEFVRKFKVFIPQDKSFQQIISQAVHSSNLVFFVCFFIGCAVDNVELKQIEIPNHKAVSLEIAKMLRRLIKSQNNNMVNLLITQFSKLKYDLILPNLALYLAEMFIKEKKLDEAKQVLEPSSHFEKHRIYAWISRLEGDVLKADKELIKYRECLTQDINESVSLKMMSLSPPKNIPNNEEQAINALQNLYEQTETLKQDIAIEYGLNRNTCFEVGCTDCCTKTFPYVSYTEYLYLRRWLDKQPDKVKTHIYKQSLEIVNRYKEEYKIEPPFLYPDEQNIYKYYPKKFLFDCPALVSNECTVYESQPFICRAYGYSSDLGMLLRACSFYQEQLYAANGLSPIRKVLDIISFTNFIQLVDKKLLGTTVIAPIPVWFAQDHKLTVWKARRHMLSKGWFAPIFTLMTRLYIKRLEGLNK